MMEWVLVSIVGVFAGVLSGIIGTGSSLILLPILAFAFGAKTAVPIMAVAAVLANCGRVIVWWHDINWNAVFYYSIASIPFAALGANTLISIPDSAGNLLLGLLFLGLIPIRRALKAYDIGRTPMHLVLAGGVIGFITGIVVSSGPLSLAVFSSFGLAKAGLIASEAAASFFVYGSKVTTFSQLGALPNDAITSGLIVGATLVLGTYFAKHLLHRITIRQHERIIDYVLVIAGSTLILT